MKITNFCPLIVTSHAEDIIKLFEELGFEKRHVKEGLGDVGVTDVVMADANGNKVDVCQYDAMPQDSLSIRMNVDDFDEAYAFLQDRGFKNSQGDKINYSPSSMGVSMVSPTGFKFSLSHHVKK